MFIGNHIIRIELASAFDIDMSKTECLSDQAPFQKWVSDIFPMRNQKEFVTEFLRKCDDHYLEIVQCFGHRSPKIDDHVLIISIDGSSVGYIPLTEYQSWIIPM